LLDMIPLRCACGAELQVHEVYSGGQVFCHACGSPVLVPSDLAFEDKFRFHCPHCEARVVARKASAGKKSQCPVCQKIYVVPTPPSESDSSLPKNDQRITLDADELLFPSGLPFAIGKRDTHRPEAPHPRYLHRGDIEQHDQTGPPPEAQSGTVEAVTPLPPPTLEPEAPATDAPLRGAPPLQRIDYPRDEARLPRHQEGADESMEPNGATEPPPVESPAIESDVVELPESPRVGELRIVSGNCGRQPIRLDFRQFVVGTERDCNLRPAGGLLSRHHCVFKKDEYALRVRDLGSTTGTFVNGRRIFGEVILNSGDEVIAGNVKLFVVLPRSPEVMHFVAMSDPSISDFVIL
jgi:hypothetical protein